MNAARQWHFGLEQWAFNDDDRLAQAVTTANDAYAALVAENARYRNALERIADYDLQESIVAGEGLHMTKIAREALAGSGGDTTNGA